MKMQVQSLASLSQLKNLALLQAVAYIAKAIQIPPCGICFRPAEAACPWPLAHDVHVLQVWLKKEKENTFLLYTFHAAIE